MKWFKKLRTPLGATSAAIIVIGLLNVITYLLPVNLLTLFGGETIDRNSSINYAPEVWLALLAFVFGTLIIVISIASESAPKLIDLFVRDPKSKFFIWLITISILENILLQLVHSWQTLFFDNMIFLNNYILLPAFVMLAIPYIFYILRYTKSSNVITKIYEENREAIQSAEVFQLSKKANEEIQRILFNTVNQLHDFLQYIKFNEPKSEIINNFGESLRLYLQRKRSFHPSFFLLSEVVKNDISLKTLSGKFDSIEKGKIFYEKKVLRVLSTTYVKLVNDGNFDLASLCGSELYKSGKIAAELGDNNALDEIIIHFNTQLRYGINNGLKTKEIRNVYNTIFHYSQLACVFQSLQDDKRTIRFCTHLSFYAGEAYRLSRAEPSFSFLIAAFAIELKEILIESYACKKPRQLQAQILLMLNDLACLEMNKVPFNRQRNSSGIRLIQIGLCLFYINESEDEFKKTIIKSIRNDLSEFNSTQSKKIISQDCERISNEDENFWEETDQGNRNIFFSKNKIQLPEFTSLMNTEIDSIVTDISLIE